MVAFIILTVYWNVGNSFDSSNLPNQASMLFMVALLPGFASVSYGEQLLWCWRALELVGALTFPHTFGNRDKICNELR